LFEVCLRRYLWCQLFLLLLVLPAPAFPEETLTIRLKPEALILTRTYALSEIAELVGVEPLLRAKLNNLVVGYTPRPGQSDLVTRSAIGARLERCFPDLSTQLLWEGPTSVHVRGGGITCDVNAVRQAARAALSSQLGNRFERVNLEEVGKLDEITVPVGKLTFHASLPEGQRLKKRMPVWVDVLVDNEHFQTVPVWFAVTAYAPVLMTKQTYQQYHRLQPEDVTETIMDVTTLQGIPLAGGLLKNSRFSRGMNAGSVITEDDVEPIPAVSQGQLVKVYAYQGGVSLTSKGIALSDGEILQIIAVRNPGSGESFQAVVVGKDQVRAN